MLVATPGRLIDHIQEKVANLGGVEIFVLDEADQMLDLGFLPPIRKIVATLPKQRQNLFFSATMPTEIGKLAGELLKDPAKVSVAPQATTVARIQQSILFVETDRKRHLLAELLSDPKMARTLVFTRTKRGADRVAKYLEQSGIEADAIHGDKSQGQRERALAAFKAGKVRALVATDIAARGIDVDAVSHVVNFDLPNVPESYVHRIGRTARAGADGIGDQPGRQRRALPAQGHREGDPPVDPRLRSPQRPHPRRHGGGGAEARLHRPAPTPSARPAAAPSSVSARRAAVARVAEPRAAAVSATRQPPARSSRPDPARSPRPSPRRSGTRRSRARLPPSPSGEGQTAQPSR